MRPAASALLDLAREVAAEAVDHVRSMRPAGRVGVADTKSSPTDLVTAIDRSCEDLIRSRILQARPDDAFIGEEGQDVPGTSGVEWIVDPIDGTVNFVYGIPRYAVAIAARVDGIVQAGVVANIATGETFVATLGGGAWQVDGAEPRRLTGPPDLPPDQMLVATGFNYVRDVRTRQADAVARLLPHVRDIRRIGAAALDLTDLALGRLDAFVEQGLKLWDVAAAGLIATEAGLVLTGPGGTPSERLVVAVRPTRLEQFDALVRDCGF